MSNNAISDELNDFLEEHKWWLKTELTPDTRIEEDMGITGDEAIEFLIEFSEHFNVDVSNFMAADYFEGEGIDIFSFLRRKKIKKILIVGHLDKAIKAGALNEETINAKGE